MRLFISWSGVRSHRVASALATWLPTVIQEVDPYISEGIDAGTRWLNDVNKALEGCDFGVVCVTAENQASPWLNFEAGALAKRVQEARVVPLAIDLRLADIALPLGQFQAQTATREGIKRLVASINKACKHPLEAGLLATALQRGWPDLEAALSEALADAPAALPARKSRDLLEEALLLLRRSGAAASPDSKRTSAAGDELRFIAHVGPVAVSTPSEPRDLMKRLQGPVDEFAKANSFTLRGESSGDEDLSVVVDAQDGARMLLEDNLSLIADLIEPFLREYPYLISVYVRTEDYGHDDTRRVILVNHRASYDA